MKPPFSNPSGVVTTGASKAPPISRPGNNILIFCKAITSLFAISLTYENSLFFLNVSVHDVSQVGARKSRSFVSSFLLSFERLFLHPPLRSFSPLFRHLFLCLLRVYLCVCLFVYHTICFVPEDTDVILLFANRRDIRRIRIGSDLLAYGEVVTRQIAAVAIDYDYDTGFIYWTDVTLGNIQRALFDDTRTIEVVVGDLKSPEGLAVDWINKKLYWTDAGADVIEVAEFNGRDRMALITTGLKNPRAIVVHPISG